MNFLIFSVGACLPQFFWVFTSFPILFGPLLNSSFSMSALYWEAQKWVWYSACGLMSVEMCEDRRDCWKRITDSLGLLASHLVLTAQAVLHLCYQGALLMFISLSASISGSLPAMLFPSRLVPSLYHCKGLLLPKCSTLWTLSRANAKFLLAHFSNLSRSLGMAAGLLRALSPTANALLLPPCQR